MAGIKYPFGKADVTAATTATAMPVTVSNQFTYKKLTANLTAATVITVTVDNLADGAELYFEIPCGATAYNTTFDSTNVTSAGVTGVINKTKVIRFVYVNGKFVETSQTQIN